MPSRPDTANLRESGYGAAIGTAILDPDRPEPAGIVGPRGKAAVKRFNVYRNNVTHSLVTALTEIFPAVARILGERNFRMIGREFLRAHPPRSRLVFEYGHGFADFLAGFKPIEHLKYLPDVARLERAWLDVYHATDAAPLPPEALGALPPEALATARFQPHPAARLIRSGFAIHAIFTAHRGGRMPERIDAGIAENVLVTRPHLKVGLYRLEPGQAAFFEALIDGTTLQDAAERALEADMGFDLSGAIATLLESGAFCACRPDGNPSQTQE